MTLDYRILGTLEVRADGVPLDLGGARQRRLLGALILAGGREIPADRLVEIVWAGDPPEQARNTLRTYVARARRALEANGPAPLVTDSNGWRLERADDALDSWRFESMMTAARSLSADPVAALAALEEALALWRADAFVEFAGEDWCAGEAVRLNELRQVAEEERFEAMLGCGLYDDAIGELERFTELHTLRDRPRGQLMLALYRAGRQVEAIRQYQDYRRYLADEVGVEPSDELRALDLRIVNRDPSLRQDTPARRQLRGYQLGLQVGEGAFGRIYRATQPTLGREVAIKVIRPDLADAPEFIRRFDGEARVIARLEHPHIVPLFDYWREPGGAYLVMRYLRGGNAKELLASNGPLSLSRVARIVDEIGAALAAAHAQGVVHCDVKPANILFDDDGGSYLSDFGIATGIGALPDHELDGNRVAYLSPERTSGGGAAASADIYAFGAVLFELLTGQVALQNDASIPTLIESQHGPVLKLTELRPDLPEALDEVIRRATTPDPDDRYATIAELVAAFHLATDSRHDGRRTPAPRSNRPNPYKGLAAFDEADAANFFGRDRLIEQLAADVAASPFVAVVGPSGSGKSSVVRAGLAPRLLLGGAYVVSMLPSEHPMEELTSALLRIAPESQADATRRALRDGDEGLVEAAELALPDRRAQLVVIVDQFEELFTVSSAEQREEFLRTIAAAADDADGRIRVVATIRADFFDRPLSHPVISELVREHTVAVTPLTSAELERAITGPAERAGVVVEPTLVTALVAESTGSPASLPLVQYVLADLYDRRDSDVLETASYHQRGGLSGAVAQRADELYEQCDAADRGGIRRLFSRLVVPGEGTEDTRRRVRRSELVTTVPPAVIDSYANARLLTFDHDAATREPTVEVAHEALIREWPRFRAWLDADRDGLRILRHVSGATTAWIESGREPGELYRGGRLDNLEDWAASNPDGLNESEVEFLEASAAARDAEVAERQQRYDDQLRSNRRLRRLLVGVGVFAVLALVAGLLALQQRQRADEEAAQAEFDRLVTLASSLPEQDLQLAMLAAVEAFDMQDAPESRGALQGALMTEPRFTDRIQTIEEAGPPTMGPDGEWLFVPEVVPGAELTSGTWYDTATFDPIGSMEVEDRWRLDSAPDRTLVAATFLRRSFDADDDERLAQVRLYDAEGQELATLNTTGRPTVVEFVDTDRLVVNDDNGLTIWDLDTFEARQTISVDGSVLESIEVNDDRSLLLVSSTDSTITTPSARLVDLDEAIVRPGSVAPCDGRCPIRFSPSGDEVAIGGDGGAVIRDTTTWEIVTTIVAPDDRVESLDFSDDGATLYVGTLAGELAFYDVRSGERSAPSIDTRAPGATGELWPAADGHVITVSSPGVIQRWSLDLSGPFGMRFESNAGAGVFSPDGSRFVRTNDPEDGWVTVYDPATGDAVEAHELVQSSPLGTLAISPTGERMAVNTPASGDVVVYDAETLLPTGAVLRDQGFAFLTFSPDGERLALGANFTPTAVFAAHVWDIESGDVTQFELTTDFDGAGGPTWNPDGTQVALSDLFGGDAVFDAETGNQVGSRFSVRGQGEAHDVLWEPDGDSVLGVGAQGVSRWDVVTRERTSPFNDATPADWIDIADDGRLLATASREGQARLWDLEAGVPLGAPFPDPGLGSVDVGDLTFAPFPDLSGDGRYLALSGLRGSVVWSLDPEFWRERACHLAGRNMTESEWASVMGDVPYRRTCERWSAGSTTSTVAKATDAESGAELNPDTPGDEGAFGA